MKKLLLYGCLLLCCTRTIRAQNGNTSVITYIAEIPIIIKSGLYIDTLTNGKTLHTISGKISIALAPRKMAILSDHYFKIANPINSQRVSQVEYRYFINTEPDNHWFSLPHQDTNATKFPYAGLLADTSIRANEKLVIQFRYKRNQKIIQQNIFSRPELLPSIFSYRQKEQFDSLDNHIKSKAVKDSKKLPAGFDTLKDSRITVLPGKYPEFLFKKFSLNKDSCIQFRLREVGNKENTAWKLTGHLLTLNTVTANSAYILEVKYLGMDAFNTYRINALPFWYQTSWAMILFVILGVVALTGLPYIFYIYKLRKGKQKRARVQEQLKTVQSQLNPHFVYNALSSIEGLVTNKENERANEYLAAFSDIMRDTLKNSDLLFISLSRDIEMLEKYIRIEQLRFEFKYTIYIDPRLDPDAIEFPPMLLQPSIENAVKHGISGLGSKGVISISFLKKETNLEIIIKDNGVKREHKIRDGHGYGIKFTNERITNLRKLYRKEKIEYQLFHSENGTIVTFFFENWIQ